MIHFANADRAAGASGPTEVAEQLAALQSVAGDWPEPRSFANSAALFLRPEVKGDSVRPGIALYGAATDESHTAAQLGRRACNDVEVALDRSADAKCGSKRSDMGRGSQHRVRCESASSRAVMRMDIRAMRPMERRCWSKEFGYRLPAACRWT